MRSRFQQLAPALAFAVVASALCAQVALARKNKETSSSQMPEQKRAIHALSRLTFGPRPGDTNRVMAMGVDNWIDQQLHPDKIDDHTLEARTPCATAHAPHGHPRDCRKFSARSGNQSGCGGQAVSSLRSIQ